jgi:hypothetical protein
MPDAPEEKTQLDIEEYINDMEAGGRMDTVEPT